MVSPDTMNSSMRIIHGPIWSRPAAASAARRGGRFGPDLEVVVDHRGLAVEQEAGVRRVGSSIGSRSSSSCTSRSRNVWNGAYHSRSQCVWGTMATVGRPARSGYEPTSGSLPAIQR